MMLVSAQRMSGGKAKTQLDTGGYISTISMLFFHEHLMHKSGYIYPLQLDG